MMDPLWSETCWSTFKYFIILIVSTYYILCISWLIKSSIKLHVTLLNKYFLAHLVSKKHLLVSSCPSVLASVRIYQCGFHWTDLLEIWYWRLSRISVQRSQILFKLDRNVGHFTGRPKCVSHCWQRQMKLNNTRNDFLCFQATLSISVTLLTATCRPIICLQQRERIFAFRLQQWLREQATLLRYKHIGQTM